MLGPHEEEQYEVEQVSKFSAGLLRRLTSSGVKIDLLEELNKLPKLWQQEIKKQLDSQ